MSIAEDILGKHAYQLIFNNMFKKRTSGLDSKIKIEINKLNNHVIQIFSYDRHERITNIGSATPVQIQGKKFLLSASHCFSGTIRLHYNGNLDYTPFCKTVVSNLNVDKTEDIFIGELKQEVDLTGAIYVNMSAQVASFQPGSVIGFIGYPKNMNGTIWDTNILKNRPMAYWESSIPVTLSGYDDIRHIAMKFNIRRSKDNIAGIARIAPSPKGFSGGPVFKLSNSLQDVVSPGWYVNPNDIIGIGIEEHKQYLLGHKMTYILEVMVNFGLIEGTPSLSVDKGKYECSSIDPM